MFAGDAMRIRTRTAAGLATAALLLAASPGRAQSFNYTWTFDGSLTGSGVVGVGNPVAPTNVVLGNFTRSDYVAEHRVANVFSSTTWTTGTAVDPLDYLGYMIGPASGRLLHLTTSSFGHQRNVNGPQWVQTQLWSGGAAIESAEAMSTPTGLTSAAFGFTDIITADALEFRWYAYNAVTGTGTYRLDNVNLPGAVYTLSDNVTLTADTNLYAGATDFATSGAITGAFRVTKTGAGTVTLSGDNLYSGGTTVSAGVLVAGSSTAFGSGRLTASGGTVRLNGGNVVVASLDGVAGSVVENGHATSAATLAVGGDGASTTFAGTLRDGTSSAGLTLLKQGSGTLDLTGTGNTFTGGVQVNGGVLRLAAAGATTGTGPVAVASGGTLSGIGSVGGAVAVAPGGTLRPGLDGVGALSADAVTLQTGSTFALAITVAGGTAAVGSGGSGTSGGVFTALANAGTLTLQPGVTIGVDGTAATFTPGATYSYVVAMNLAADVNVSGQANADGSPFVVVGIPDGSVFDLSGLDGGPLILSVTIVAPEPKSVVPLAVAAVGVARWVLRRRSIAA